MFVKIACIVIYVIVLFSTWVGKSLFYRYVFSKSMARMMLFVRALFLLLGVLMVLSTTNAVVSMSLQENIYNVMRRRCFQTYLDWILLTRFTTVNVGRAWTFGTGVSLLVMYSMSTYRWSPEGDMVFCRSLGQPIVEEYDTLNLY